MSATAVVAAAPWADLAEDATRLTDAQTARTVLAISSEGVLCTQAAVPGAEGAAFASHAPYVVDEDGCPLTPLRSIEAKGNLAGSKLLTFFARAPRGGAAGGSAVSLIGKVEEIASDDITDAQLAAISQADGTSVESLAQLPWLKLTPSRVHLFDATRGIESWVVASEYADCEPNPLGDSASVLLSKVNCQHADALRRFTAVYAGVSQAELTRAEVLGVDHLGFDLRYQLGEAAPPSSTRIGFKLPPANLEEATSLFMKLFQEAYEKQTGAWAA